MSFTVAIVGRPNVGKSTLFNRLIGERQAIVDDTSGVTRDRQYGIVNWAGKDFNIIDTGGFVTHSDDVFEKEIRQQVQIAIEEASLIMFLLDVTVGITDIELDIARMLRKSNKEVLVVINKVDNNQRLYDVNEFYSLGFNEYYPLSSISGSGTGELLDAVTDRMKDEPEEDPDAERLPKIAIVGQPNVGKSSLLNAMIGEQRNIVTDIAVNTRDTIHTRYKLFNKDLLLIDTAGIRKKGKVHENLEFYSVIRAIKAIDDADICVLMIDATTGIEGQDLKIFSLAVKKRKGLIIAVNKWDLVEDKQTNTTEEYEKKIKARVAPFTDIPVLFISALSKQRIFKVIETALEIYDKLQLKISTSKLNDIIQEAVKKYPPPSHKGKMVSIKYSTQIIGRSFAIALFCNHPKYIKDSYKNYIENTLRQKLDLKGVPFSLVFKEK